MAVLGCLLSTGVRRLHCNAAALAGGQWRLQQGLAANPSGYGPLTELPDWSYAGERWPPCASYEGPASKKSPKGEVCTHDLVPPLPSQQCHFPAETSDFDL
ncbi:39S ribosomal protein L52, mitochondrial isoform X6 [Manis pentadactyla]|uniref:39S ribosomal protein L52, mitochondrial isoform X6 n=1 Tax=Manis pentadactyla TaxID=143292 RepID=UPI00255C587C|nr:39S ribosomal protein L52, mitochondrial isoform X6 [Manis pentadactyla]